MKRTLYLKEQDNLLSLAASNRFTDYNKILCNELGLYSIFLIKVVNVFSPFIFILLVVCSLFYYLYCFIKSIVIFFISGCKRQSQGKISGPVFLCYTPLLEQRLDATDIVKNNATWVLGPGVELKKKEGRIIRSLNNLNFFQCLQVFSDCISTLCEYIVTHKSLYPIHKAWSFYTQRALLFDCIDDADIYFSNQCDRWALLFDGLPAKTKTLVQHGITYSTPLPWRLKNVGILYAFSERAANEVCLSILEGHPDIRVMSPTIFLTDIPSAKKKVLIISHINHFELEKTIIERLCSIPEIQVIVKKHPTLTNYSCYSEIQKEYGFHFIIDSVFPKVDYVISYFSTLAYEYMAYNIPVYVYMKEEECDYNQILVEIKNLLHIK